MKSIGIKLADGSFYPIMKDGSVEKKALDVTTVQDNQTKVQIDLYRSETDSMEDAEYVDTLEISNLKPHPNGIPSLHLNLSVDENNHLQAEVRDPETGKTTSTNVTLVNRTELERNEPVNFNIDTTTADALSDIDAVDSVLKNGMTDSDSILKDSEGNSILDTSTFTLTEEKPETEIFASAEDLKNYAPEAESDTILKDSEGNSILDTSTFTLTEEKPESEIFATEEDLNFMPQDNSTYTDAGEANNRDNFFEAPSVMEESGTVLEEQEPSVEEGSDSFSDEDFDFELPNLESILKTKGDAENADRIIVQSTRQNLVDHSSIAGDMPIHEETEETLVEDGSNEVQEEVSVVEQDAPSGEQSVSADLELPDFTPPETSPELTPKTPQENVVKATLPDLDLSDFGDTSSLSSEDFGLPNFDDADEYPSAEESTPSYTEETVAEEPVVSESVADNSDVTDVADESDFTVPEDSVSEKTISQEEPEPYVEERKTSFTELDSSAVLAAGTKDAYDLPNFDNLEPTGIEDVDMTSSLVQDEDFTEPEVSDFDEAVKSIPDSSETVMDLPDFEDSSFGEESDANAGTEFTVPEFATDSPASQNFYEDSGDKKVSDYDLFDEAEDGSSANSYAPQSNMFEGLYDKETLSGNSSSRSSYDDDDKEGGSALPVIVCVVCSIICILGALLVLFVIPSKINIFNKKTETHIAKTESEAGVKSTASEKTGSEDLSGSLQADTSAESDSSKEALASADQTHNAGEALPPPQKKDGAEKAAATTSKPKEEVVPAKENEIVIAATPQQVVPEKPARPSRNAPDIRYKIVWGDTLWDISNAYYKTPWRYQHIADHNHIKNPDYIQAGSTILIPSD
ncbi:MAG: LysM peptidoglycan-binding domain-containing protein [Treponema sp.]|nr:LysM peptidoglycan-binding domain-containing protein [Treponema sp.]